MQNYNKDKYIQKKKEQLKYAYKMIDDACDEIKNNNNFFKEYLDIQSRFDKYTFRNALLVAKQFPNAIQLKDYYGWKNSNVFFKNKNPNKIIILEPREAYLNSSGVKITPYSAKEMIDVSETNVKASINNYDKKMVLNALLCDSPIKIKVSDTLGDKVCMWSKKDNTIYVKNNETYDYVISSIVREVAKYLIYVNTGEYFDEKAKCISYMICKKYNIDYPFMDILNPLVDLDITKIKDELSSMKNIFDDINNRMIAYLDKRIKDKSRER